MSLENYKQLLSELGQSTGIPGLTSDNDNYCCLGFDDKIIVHLQYHPENDTLMFFSQLGKIDEDKTAILYPRLLKANLFWQGTAGSTIGVDDETREILMSYQTPLTFMDFPKFQAVLEGFINTAELWINTLEAFQHAGIPKISSSVGPNMQSGIKA
jgi:hypothetical protein